MQVIRDPQELSLALKKKKNSGKSKIIGFVPTMGALHAGHLSLIERAAQDNHIVVVSVFVNPTQFGPQEDLKNYPRLLKQDLKLCRKQGVDFVFIPDSKIMYPEGYSTFINVEKLSLLLCGVKRPGHFRGVVTVVAKLLNIIQPDNLYLGQKDAQQAVIISRMIKDLNFPVKVKLLPTVRQEDGLALSSRNVYLSKLQRSNAPVLFKALQLAEILINNGQRNAGRIISRMKQLIEKNKQAKIDYISIVGQEELKETKKVKSGDLIVLAVKIGKTRLIDNMIINFA